MQTYPTAYAESHRMAEKIFREILPRHGMAVREEQIALCHEVLDTLYNKEISLCEAGVGTGKTLAYLVACILWQMNRPERMKLPIVISTSSVALQDAILTEYLPDLSTVLLGEGIIREPITAVVRKGKERFVCDARLAERTALVQPSRKRQKNSLRIAENILDMDHIPELSRYDRCRICVPQSCPRDCFMRLDCRYQQYLRDSMKPDIQICNHNYLLADASHRIEDRPLLLRSYQALVVDEAHKLPDVARQMYTETLSETDINDLCLQLQQAHYLHLAQRLRSAFLAFSISCGQNLSGLRRKDSVSFTLTPFRREALADCIAILQYAGAILGMPRYLRHRLGEAESFFRLFLLEVPTRILYIDYDADGQPTFCAASSRIPQLLRSALWNTREPAILTSGTLAAAGDFSHTEQLLGLAAYRPLRHFRADSPFDYKKKCLLYFPPRARTRVDNRHMAEEIIRLVDSCHGHALVLFTSYRQMAEVRALTDGQWPYQTYQAWRNGGKIIQQFKQSGNGVLFAAGSCWEGIDFPGDMVSLLIIAKLPFPIPDPVSDYERKQYPNLRDYINAEIIPEMQKKLRQGFGRAIRTEQDSCVVAVLDERAGIGGKYYDAVLAALPTCPTTEKIEDVQQFIREQKRPDYFL
jgi:ATP-dependent DNA helicase DinG